jgi:hypothetical protein
VLAAVEESKTNINSAQLRRARKSKTQRQKPLERAFYSQPNALMKPAALGFLSSRGKSSPVAPF